MERLLYETLVKPQIVEAAKDKLPPGVIMQVKAKVGQAGKVTANGRLYRREIMAREVAGLQARIKEREVEGLAGHPNQATGGLPDPSTASYVLTGLSMDEAGAVMADIDIYETSAGKDLAARCRAGVKVGFSSRGHGSARKILLTDKHPAFAENRDWQGKEIEEVGDDYKLRSFDHVIGQAVDDAKLRSFREQEEGSMSFDMSKLTAADWESILKAEQVQGAIKAAVTEAQAKFDAGLKADVMKEVADYLRSEAFIDDHFEIDEGEPDADEDPVDEAAGKPVGKIKCKACGASIPSGSKFCPECGEDPTVDPEAEEQRQEAEGARDKRVAELEKQIADMKAEKAAREEADAQAHALAEATKGKPGFIAEAVAADAKAAKVESKRVAEFAKGRIAFYEGIVAKGGGARPAGVAPVKPQDDQSPAKNEASLVDNDMVEMAR